jgi:hypothetical protein
MVVRISLSLSCIIVLCMPTERNHLCLAGEIEIDEM